MPPFEKIDPSRHTSHRSWKRGFSEAQWRLCVEQPDRILKAPLAKGMLGGFIWRFQKHLDGRTLQIVAEVYKNECYPITGYWMDE